MRCPPCEKGLKRVSVGFIGPGQSRQVWIHQDLSARPFKIYPCAAVPYVNDHVFLTHQIRTSCNKCRAQSYMLFRHDIPNNQAGILKCSRCKNILAALLPTEPLAPCVACGILRRTGNRLQTVVETHDCPGYTHVVRPEGEGEGEGQKTVCGASGGFAGPPTCPACLHGHEAMLSDATVRSIRVREELDAVPGVRAEVIEEESDARARSRLLELD